MSALSAQDATGTFDCKTPDCSGTAKFNRGRWAYLCDSCKTAAAASASSNVLPLRPTLRDGFEAKAKALVSVGKKLDKTLANYRRKQASIQPAKQAFDAAMREWSEACRALGGES